MFKWDKINIAKQSPSISPSASPSQSISYSSSISSSSSDGPGENVKQLIDELKLVLNESLKIDADILRIKFLFDQIDKELNWID